jgi:DNA invertase Pin-like site-specific DNA recombinase
MDAALYVRISESDQSRFSIDAQLAACRKHAKQQGWRVVQEYVERGRSAKNTDRPEFQAMIAAAKAGKFQVIIVQKLDRFARNREDAVIYKALLRRVDVQVVSVTEQFDDGPMGRLVEGILEVVADWFLVNLREETIKGMRRMAQEGY